MIARVFWVDRTRIGNDDRKISRRKQVSVFALQAGTDYSPVPTSRSQSDPEPLGRLAAKPSKWVRKHYAVTKDELSLRHWR